MDTTPGHYTASQANPVTDASVVGWITSDIPTPYLDDNTFAVAQSDIIRVWLTTGEPVGGNMVGSTFQANTAVPYAARDLILLADCQRADLALVCRLSGKTADLACVDNQAFSLPNPDHGLQAYQYAGVLYYVGKRSKQAQNPPSLFRRVDNQ